MKLKSFLDALPAPSDEYAKGPYMFLDRVLNIGGKVGEMCSFDSGIAVVAKGMSYAVAGGKPLSPYLTGLINKPVIYCDARLPPDASMRLWAAIHARNTKRPARLRVGYNLQLVHRRDPNLPLDSGLVSAAGRDYVFSLLGENPGLLVIDDLFTNKDRPLDEKFSMGSMISFIRTLIERGWTVLVLRDLNVKNYGQGFDEYLQMLDFRITASVAKGGTAQEETRLVLTHQLMHDYDPALLGAHVWTGWHEGDTYPLIVPVERKLAIARGQDIRVSRIDIDLLLKVPSRMHMGDFINAIAFAGFSTGLPIKVFPRESTYFDPSSQSHAVKFYDKAAENASKRKPCWPDSPNVDRLKQVAGDYVRVEFVFRKKYFLGLAELGGELPHPEWLTRERLAQMVLKAFDKLNLHGQLETRLPPHALQEIPLPYRTTVALWQNGEDLGVHMAKRTVAEHRKYLWKEHSIEIGCPPPSVFGHIDLAKVLSPANFVPVPDDIRADPTLFYDEDINEIITRFEQVIANKRKVA